MGTTKLILTQRINPSRAILFYGLGRNYFNLGVNIIFYFPFVLVSIHVILQLLHSYISPKIIFYEFYGENKDSDGYVHHTQQV